MRSFMSFLRRGLWLFGAAVLAAGCAGLGAHSVTLSQADLQRLLERQFPRDQRVFELLDVKMTRPVVQLVPERNRIVTALDLSAMERLSGKTVRGSFALEHGLRYEPSDATLRLANVRVNDLKLDVGGTLLQGQVARLGAVLAERALDDFVIYRVADDKREALRRAGVQNADIAVTSRGVELKFAEPR
jgi:hypothetical protein